MYRIKNLQPDGPEYSIFQRVLRWAYTKYVLTPTLERMLEEPKDEKVSMAMIERQYNDLH